MIATNYTGRKLLYVLCVVLALSGCLRMKSQSPVRFLTSEANTTDYWPCFSPDGKSVLFSRSTDQQRTWEFFIVPSSGGTARRFSAKPLPVSATRANWSSRNNRIAFTGEGLDDSASVWTMHADGTQAEKVTATGLSSQVYYPSWFPDGNRLAVVDFGEDDSLGGVIKQVDLRNGVVTSLTDRKQVLAGMPSVSPDGKWIAFAGQANRGQAYDQKNNSIWLLDEAEHARQLENEQGRAPSWSPDSQWISFESNRGNPNQEYAVYIMDRNGTKARPLTEPSYDATHPVFSSDTKRMVFSAKQTATKDQWGSIAILNKPLH